jgi:hypothetical protein
VQLLLECRLGRQRRPAVFADEPLEQRAVHHLGNAVAAARRREVDRRRVDDEQILDEHALPLREGVDAVGEPERLLDRARLLAAVRAVAALDAEALPLHLVLARLDGQAEQVEAALGRVGA